jgi:tetratricopeptide (TPR) repeat protein
LQDKNGTIKDWIRNPRNSGQGSRPNVQKSIFVQPPEGFIEPDEEMVVPKALKQPILKYLEDEFHISTERIYPDLQGFVSRQKTRLGTYKELGKGRTCQQNGDQADNSIQKNKHYKQAVRHFTNATQQMPGVALAYNGRGLAYLSKDEPDNALADFNKAIELDQGSKEAYKGRSAIYRVKSYFDKAIDDAIRLVQLDPTDDAAYCALYLAYSGKDDFENAIASLNEAIRLNPDQPLFYSSRGDTYLAKSDFDHAIKDYNKAIQLNPNFPRTYCNRGWTYILQKEWTKAKADLTIARDMEMNIIDEFCNNFGSIADFEKITEIRLPTDIAAMLTPAQTYQ